MPRAHPNPVDRAVGERIKSVRVEKRMSQDYVAELCGVTFQQIQKYEKGFNRITVGRLVQLGRVLGVDPDWLLKDYATGKPGPDFIDRLLSENRGLRAQIKEMKDATKRR